MTVTIHANALCTFIIGAVTMFLIMRKGGKH
jgi:hypothetical protein